MSIIKKFTSMTRHNLVPKISLVIFCSIIAYALLVMTMARPAPAEGYGARIAWEMVAVTFVLSVVLFVTVAIGVWRAMAKKDYLWLILQLGFMPSAYFYTLVINKGAHAGPSTTTVSQSKNIRL